MNFTKTWPAAIFVVSLAVCTSEAWAQNSAWDDVWQEKTAPSAAASSANWNQRVLKRPETMAQRPTPQRWVSPTRVAQRTTGDISRVEASPSPSPLSTTPPAAKEPKIIPEVIEPGTIQYESPGADSIVEGNPGPRRGCSSCGDNESVFGGEMEGCDECGECVEGEVCDFGYEVFDGRCPRLLRDLSVFAGADAFKGPPDHGKNGNFGLNEGLALSGPLGDPWGCGYEIGANFVQSNFSGAPTLTVGDYSIQAPFRRQVFATAGIFRRSLCRGFQWGVAFDYLHDDYYEKTGLKQLRSETGFVLNNVYEIGYFGNYGVGTDRVYDGTLDSTDMFALYVRRNFENGGQGRLWGGATGYGDGLLGADLWVPLGRGFALENRVTYMIPKQGANEEGQTRESWGFVVQLVWYPGQNAKCQQQNPYRALFPVADNSLFMVDRLAK